MLREILDERLKTEFNDESEIKEDSIIRKKSHIEFVEGVGTSTYWFSTEKANYEMICSYKISVEPGIIEHGDPYKQGEDPWKNHDYKIQSLKLRE